VGDFFAENLNNLLDMLKNVGGYLEVIAVLGKKTIWRAREISRVCFRHFDESMEPLQKARNIEHPEMQSALFMVSVSTVVLSHRNYATAGTFVVASVLWDKISGTFCIIITQ
jgi:hypothetical protein